MLEQAVELYNQYNMYVLGAVIVIDYLLGCTNFLKSNSVFEIPLRMVGYVIVFLFGKKFNLKMDKKKALRE